MKVSERRKLVERLYRQLTGEELPDWVAGQRDPTTSEGRVSWRRIAADLYEQHDIEVTDVTLINWYADAIEQREGAA